MTDYGSPITDSGSLGCPKLPPLRSSRSSVKHAFIRPFPDSIAGKYS
jgi:hypothetical protein